MELLRRLIGQARLETYRGWEPFAAPETRAIADFVKSRVVEGQQQIRTHMSFHANGELILYPWAYTRRNLVGAMTRADRDAFKAMAFDMAATNGYQVLQSAEWYITDGDEIDWMYGRQGIFSFTLEVYPPLGTAQPLSGRRKDREADPAQPRGAAVSHRPGRLSIPRQRYRSRALRARLRPFAGQARRGSPQLG